MKQIQINKTEKSIAEYILREFPAIRKNNLTKMWKANKIKVNSKKIPLEATLARGDLLSLYIDDSYLVKPTPENSYLFSQDILDIVYEDDNLLIVNKPSGIPVNDDNWQNFDTLINRIIKYYRKKESNINPKLCHRLDTGTSGIILVAKNDAFLDFILNLFKEKHLKKEYVCLVYGTPSKNHAVLNAFLTKNSHDAYVTVSEKPKNKNSKSIQTEIHLVNSKNNISLLNVNLITGRTHQIRAHLSYIGIPVLGDSRYGINTVNRKMKLKYQLLCSKSLKFPEITDHRYSYLSSRLFSCPDPWFVEAFINNKL